MKKKSKKPVQKKKTGPTLMDKLPRNQGERLFLMIKLTKRAYTNPELESQKYLARQIAELTQELSTWEHANPTVHIRDVFSLLKGNKT